MTAAESLLLTGVAASVLFIVLSISKLRLHAFPALLIAAVIMGVFAGRPVPEVTQAIEAGFGQILGGVGPVLGLGAMLGAVIAGSGSGRRLADAVVGLTGPRCAPWTLAAAAMLIGAPLFFETGVVLIMPVIIAVGARIDRDRPVSGRSGTMHAAIAAFAGLSVMHGLVPPHPGPMIALDALQAPLARTFLLGLLIALPTVALTGPLYGAWAARIATPLPPSAAGIADPAVDEEATAGGRASRAAIILLIPVLLILLRSLFDLSLPASSPLRVVFDLVGAPAIALLVATLLALVFLGRSRAAAAEHPAAGIPAVASILLVIGGGGAFKQVLVTAGIGPMIAHGSAALSLPPLLVGWLIAALIRVMTGSATVATITASGVMAASLHAGLHVDLSLLVLSIGGGSLFLSHVNDAGFWIVREYLGLSVQDTLRTWSVMETIISLLVLTAVMVIGAVL
jgi:GntP family gluconate:H+ symporter